MSKVFRVMEADNGRPKVGAGPNMLGVRVPKDVQLDEENNVFPGGGGLSVGSKISKLPYAMLPTRLRQFEHLNSA
jgi:hypothetical protein